MFCDGVAIEIFRVTAESSEETFTAVKVKTSLALKEKCQDEVLAELNAESSVKTAL